MSLDRREFLRVAGLQAGIVVTGARAAAARAPTIHARPAPDVCVIGAGAFGIWTALNLRRLGASVTVVDQHGPGNSRATSGGETRGVRSSYGERTTWVRWANEAIRRWLAWDEEWRARLNLRLFFQTSDLILRENVDDRWLAETRKNWEALGTPYEVLTIDEARYRYPQINMDGFGVAVVERNAGVVRARRACEAISEVFRGEGGKIHIARASLGRQKGGRMLELPLQGADAMSAGQYVFACGPWLSKVLPVMKNRLRIPMGHVYYYGPPPGDNRFTYPNMPSYNVPGVTGWPALPPDFRGFRVRTGGRPPQDPDESVRYIEPQFLNRPRTFLGERFPALEDAPLLETRACHYESSVDRNFIVDLHPGLSNVWIAGGGSAEGFKFGPVVGEYIARRVVGAETDPALAEEFRLKEEEFEPYVAEDDDEVGTPKTSAAAVKNNR
jgi:sarcosine oxidase